MLKRIARLLSASLVAALVLSSAARASAEKGRPSRALVVLIGNAGTSEGLRSVLSELLERQGVAVEYEERAHFSPSALLSESRDTRVWVFVSQSGSRVAKLYFRGPSGARFLLRQLELKNGLDEVGRELIGQVVETSTVALSGVTATTTCAECLCTSCGGEVAAVQTDPLAADVSKCSLENHCSGDCCFCGAICSAANYRLGPCAAQIEKSAGIPSPSTTANYPALQAACDNANNVTACRKPTNLAGCISAHCSTACPGLVPACP